MSFRRQTAFVAIAAVNFTQVQEFYQRLLNQSPTQEIQSVYAEFELANLRLGIFRPKTDAEFSGAGTMSLCIEVDNLDEAIAHLQSLDLPLPEKMMTASHGREIYIYDPAGSRIILHESIAV
ncbi:VOC family protein [Microcoleus sp. FACHB-1515]|uniref:VOC family protein n=1 Tax=Cyanophyceae TaxID=3028117 RepID=UPI001687C76D|nr:VOC family protein [Microcoleus sp. FACHB-1515]MBD2092640.1 VOC family protein [Microcoleus sp. FACHB-1515]